MTPDSRRYKNRLLCKMIPSDRALLEADLELCELPVRLPIETRGQLITVAYFVESGIVSLVATTPAGKDTEIALIGYEGATVSALLLGDNKAAHNSYMQVAGTGLRISATALNAALNASTTLRQFLLRYVRSLHIQTEFTAFSNARCTLVQRLARWLLMCHDRIEGSEISITHEFLGVMLGVRRSGITVAVQFLEGAGLIRNTRGVIVVRERAGLELMAADYYGEPEREYRRLTNGPTSAGSYEGGPGIFDNGLPIKI